MAVENHQEEQEAGAVIREAYANEDGSYTLIVDMSLGGIFHEDTQYVYRPNDPHAPAELHDAMAPLIEAGDLPPLPEDMKPAPEAEAPTIVYKLDLWERSTDAEAEAILAAMQEQPVRIRMIFDAAQSFHSDHELWPLLTGAATQLFGDDRAAQLLAPSG